MCFLILSIFSFNAKADLLDSDTNFSSIVISNLNLKDDCKCKDKDEVLQIAQEAVLIETFTESLNAQPIDQDKSESPSIE